MKTVIHWFRRDFRITDNTALHLAASRARQVVPVYVASCWRDAHRWTGPNRQAFLCASLASLAQNLETLGGKLIIRRGDAVEELARLASETGASAIFFNRDPDPYGRKAEAGLDRIGSRLGIEIVACKDICIHERDEVLTGTGAPFRVFTPFSKAWAKLPRPAPSGKLRSLETPPGIATLPLPALQSWGLSAEGQVLEGGERAARQRMNAFLSGGLERYGTDRNLPAGRATSRLSQDLRFGLLSIRELFDRCEAAAAALPAAGRGSAQKYLSELIWREFSMNILWHFPNVLDEEFNPRLRGMRWPGRRAHFERWCAGETGFPIVDAAMRQMNQTGFMHNRTRMIAAMFLTKDLHLDWRLGESYFMQKLTDGEIASNNCGWQWSAGTGADAAPYFRIQNPWTQTQRYDPEGAYIKEWIPELRDVPAERLSAPPEDGRPLAKDYPAPIVDHARAREITLALFKDHRELNEV